MHLNTSLVDRHEAINYHFFDTDTFTICLNQPFTFDVQNTNATSYIWKKDGQSPLLSAFAAQVAWAVPVNELLVVGLLVVPRHRLAGLYAAFLLMVSFTAYIYIILNYSSFIPCSCGGILEKMTWQEHLIFNLVFVLLAVVAIVIESKKNIPLRKAFRPLVQFPVVVLKLKACNRNRGDFGKLKFHFHEEILS